MLLLGVAHMLVTTEHCKQVAMYTGLYRSYRMYRRLCRASCVGDMLGCDWFQLVLWAEQEGSFVSATNAPLLVHRNDLHVGNQVLIIVSRPISQLNCAHLWQSLRRKYK